MRNRRRRRRRAGGERSRSERARWEKFLITCGGAEKATAPHGAKERREERRVARSLARGRCGGGVSRRGSIEDSAIAAVEENSYLGIQELSSYYIYVIRCFYRRTVHGELRLLVDLVQPDGLVELDLAGDGAGVALLVNPLHGERVVLVEAADVAHLAQKTVVADPVVDVRDEHVAEEEHDTC